MPASATEKSRISSEVTPSGNVISHGLSVVQLGTVYAFMHWYTPVEQAGKLRPIRKYLPFVVL